MTADQSQFRAALLDPDRAVPPGLTDGQGRPAQKRFAVYRNNVTVALVDALRSSFPVLRKLLGTQNFDQLARVFARAHPPSSPLMMYYGDEMAAFLHGFEPLQHIGYLPDVARLECAMRRSYHAADAAPLAPEALASVAPEALLASTITLAPAVRLVPSQWPLYDIWRFNMIEGAPKPQASAQPVLITRAAFDPVPHALDLAQTVWVSAIINAQTLDSAQDAALAVSADFDLAPLLALLVRQGALTHIDLPED
jgi:hypothetical protein